MTENSNQSGEDLGLSLELRSVTLRDAAAWVAANHRHNGSPRGWRFGVAVYARGVMVGVGIAGRPIARNHDHATTLELTRITSDSVTRNVCSKLYGALCRAGAALGYKRAITYTRVDEDGASLRAAGFRLVHRVRAQKWDRVGRRRSEAAEVIERNLREREIA
jgi:hypothetical protein